MQTSVMIDGIIAAIFLLFAWLGWRKGLFRTLAELAAVVIALLLSVQIAGAAAPEIVDRTLRPAAHAAVEERVAELLEENSLSSSPCQELDSILAGIPNRFVREKASELLEGLDLTQETALASGREALRTLGLRAVDTALDTVVLQAIHAAICFLSFLLLLAALRLAIRALDVFLKLPVPFLSQLNRAGGLLLGALKGAVAVCLLVWLLARTGLWLTPEVLEQTRLAGAIAGWLGLAAPVSL